MDAQQDRAVVVAVPLPDVSRMSISIIIPVFNEGPQIEHTLRLLFSTIANNPAIEVIICDGGSDDNTISIANKFPCKLITCSTGRAQQMNTASEHASGDWLLFLHADSQLPDNWIDQPDADRDWGFFPIKLSGSHWLFRVIESMINLRSRISHVATGDQGLFFRRSFFSGIKGFADIPLMEDVAITKIARRHGSPTVAKTPLITSSRRWESNGILKTIVTMWGLRLAYFVGVSPQRLHRIYYPPSYGEKVR